MTFNLASNGTVGNRGGGICQSRWTDHLEALFNGEGPASELAALR